MPRGNAYAHGAAGDQQRARICLAVEVQAVEPHVAGIDSAEPADLERRVQADFSLPTLLPNTSSADFTALSSARWAWTQRESHEQGRTAPASNRLDDSACPGSMRDRRRKFKRGQSQRLPRFRSGTVARPGALPPFACGRRALRNPLVPHFLHLAERADVLQPDLARTAGLACWCPLPRAIDRFARESLWSARRQWVAPAWAGTPLPGDVDGVAVSDGLAHAGADLDTLDCHTAAPFVDCAASTGLAAGRSVDFLGSGTSAGTPYHSTTPHGDKSGQSTRHATSGQRSTRHLPTEARPHLWSRSARTRRSSASCVRATRSRSRWFISG